MNEKTIQNALWRSVLMRSSKVVVPNFTPRKWFECDVFSVSKAGYWSEWEIKLSVKDFVADATKKNIFGGKLLEKHAALREADSSRCPSYFWFVLSEEVAAKVVVPEWAGVRIIRPGRRPTFTMDRPARRLHKEPAGESLVKQAMVACYWRYWRIRPGE